MASTPTVGILHPGAMGAALGALLVDRGTPVRWAAAGRSRATRARADAAGLERVDSLVELAEASDVLLSVCPPGAALDVAREVAATGFAGTYVDANAIAPRTVTAIADALGGVVRLVDGGIVGPPPPSGKGTRIYLSGDGAGMVAGIFDGSACEPVVLAGEPGQASALKACYAHSTKVTTALVATLRALARTYDVDEHLVDEWERSFPVMLDLSDRRLPRGAVQAWRYVGEMEEIAIALADAGLPSGAPEAAAETYRRLADFKDADPLPDLDEVLAALNRSAAEEGR